ncbi:MAG: geranylgeranylglyceryl/heptaprenylglyceryl phosphate synthase [Bacteroidia bacterium]|nr:geranylgeranylglyceryl/heptaprenylglyceryl phosphate synthase [Bacteroidia bacterium]
MERPIYQNILKKTDEKKKQLAVLIDPDKFDSSDIIDLANEAGVDYFFVGGSLMVKGNIEQCVRSIKKKSSIPVIIFPGTAMQICNIADGILFISLISGRNADLLIGQHVAAAPYLKQSKLEILSTGYILVDSGRQTTASYISNTTPVPANKSEIAACTAMAGEMLGLSLIYLDAGSGAKKAVSEKMIKRVKQTINVPLLVGGGIRSAEHARKALQAGADMLVVGSAFEKNPELLLSIADAVHKEVILQG